MNPTFAIAPAGIFALLVVLAVGVFAVRAIRRRRADHLRERMMRLDGARHRGDPFDDDEDDALDSGARPGDGRWIALVAVVGLGLFFFFSISERGVRVSTNVTYSTTSPAGAPSEGQSSDPRVRRAEQVTGQYLAAVGGSTDIPAVLADRARVAAERAEADAERGLNALPNPPLPPDPFPPLLEFPDVDWGERMSDELADARALEDFDLLRRSDRGVSLDAVHLGVVVALLLAWMIWSRRAA